MSEKIESKEGNFESVETFNQLYQEIRNQYANEEAEAMIGEIEELRSDTQLKHKDVLAETTYFSNPNLRENPKVHEATVRMFEKLDREGEDEEYIQGQERKRRETQEADWQRQNAKSSKEKAEQKAYQESARQQEADKAEQEFQKNLKRLGLRQREDGKLEEIEEKEEE